MPIIALPDLERSLLATLLRLVAKRGPIPARRRELSD
jgi:hypothetical protein